MIQLILFEDNEWYKSKFDNSFTTIRWNAIPSIMRKDQILYRSYGEYGWHYILNENIREWLSENFIDYSIGFISTKDNKFNQSERLTAYINLPTTEDAVLFKLTWM